MWADHRTRIAALAALAALLVLMPFIVRKCARPRAAVHPLGYIVVPQDYGGTPPQFQFPPGLAYGVRLYDAAAPAGAPPLGATGLDMHWNRECYREVPMPDLVLVTADPKFIAVPDPHYHGRYCLLTFPPNVADSAGMRVVASYVARCVTNDANAQPQECESARTPPSATFTIGDAPPIPPDPGPEPTPTGCPEGSRQVPATVDVDGRTYAWNVCTP